MVPLTDLYDQIWISINVYYLENGLFSIVFLYKSDLGISTTEKHIGIIRIKHI